MIGGPRVPLRAMNNNSKPYRGSAARILDVCHAEVKVLEGAVTATRIAVQVRADC